MEDTFANRLKEILSIRNMKQVDLCEKTKLSSGLINKYLKGKAQARADKLTILATALDTNEVWLMGYDVPMNKDFGSIKNKSIYVRDLETNKPIDTIPLALKDNEDENNYFAVKAIDQSMAPLLDIGDIAIVYKQNEYVSDCIYLLKYQDVSIIRKIIDTPDGIELQALNVWNYPTQKNINKNEIIILGKVIKAQNESAFK